mgnify:FL=1
MQKRGGAAPNQMEQRNVPSQERIIRIHMDAAINARMIRTGKGIIARHWTGKIVRAK